MSSIRYFSTKFFFIFGITFFMYVPLLLEVVDLYYLLLSFLLLLSFSIGYLLFSKSKKRKGFFYASKINYEKISWVILFLYICYAYYLFIYVGAEAGNYEHYADKFAHASQGQLYYKIIQKSINIILLFAVSCVAYKSKKYYFLIALISILISLLSSTRLVFIFSLIYWAGYGVYFNFIKIRFIHILISIFTMPFLFAILLLKRVMKFSDNNLFSIISEMYDYLSFDIIKDALYSGLEVFVSYRVCVEAINDNFIIPLSGYIRIIFMPIPRSLWEGKPESMSRLIAKEYFPGAYYAGGGQIAGPIGDAYMNGGVVFVILIWLIVGYFASKYYFYLKKYQTINPSPYKVFIWLYYFNFLSYFVYLIRGFGTDFLWVYLCQLLVLKMILFLGFKKELV